MCSADAWRRYCSWRGAGDWAVQITAHTLRRQNNFDFPSVCCERKGRNVQQQQQRRELALGGFRL